MGWQCTNIKQFYAMGGSSHTTSTLKTWYIRMLPSHQYNLECCKNFCTKIYATKIHHVRIQSTGLLLVTLSLREYSAGLHFQPEKHLSSPDYNQWISSVIANLENYFFHPVHAKILLFLVVFLFFHELFPDVQLLSCKGRHTPHLGQCQGLLSAT